MAASGLHRTERHNGLPVMNKVKRSMFGKGNRSTDPLMFHFENDRGKAMMRTQSSYGAFDQTTQG
jgi:hypothetical protein